MADVDLVRQDATAQAELVRSGQISARVLIEKTLRRIEALDPELNAYRVVMAEDALAAADRLDAVPVRDRAHLPLAGASLAVKDDTDVAGQVTAWGSASPREPARADAEVVSRLRAAGAIVIGKTNVPELTLWPWTASRRWGTTRNPWDPERTPGGSSGGSAAAVATGMCALALGSDGGGSIRYPAGLSGVVGFKPARGRVPLGAEHGSGWHGLVVIGPLTRSVRDAMLFLDVVADRVPPGDGAAPADAARADAAPAGATSLLRIGLATDPPPGTGASLSTAGRVAVETAASLLADLGHDVAAVDVRYGRASLWSSTVRLLKGVQDDVARTPDPGLLEPRTRRVARLGQLLPSRTLDHAMRLEGRVATSMNRAFETVDVVLTPLCPSPAPRIDRCPEVGALRSLRASSTSAWLVPWNLIGQPAVAVPVGFDDEGMPTAVQLAGRADDERVLLELATQIEAARPFACWSPRAEG